MKLILTSNAVTINGNRYRRDSLTPSTMERIQTVVNALPDTRKSVELEYDLTTTVYVYDDYFIPDYADTSECDTEEEAVEMSRIVYEQSRSAIRDLMKWAGRNHGNPYTDDTERQAAGIGALLSAGFGWMGNYILLVSAAGLEKANYHDEAAVVMDMYHKYKARFELQPEQPNDIPSDRFDAIKSASVEMDTQEMPVAVDKEKLAIIERLHTAGIYPDEFYSTSTPGHYQIENIGDTARIIKKLKAAGFTVINASDDVMDDDLYAIVSFRDGNENLPISNGTDDGFDQWLDEVTNYADKRLESRYLGESDDHDE